MTGYDIAAAVIAYLLIGWGVSWFGIRRGWGFTTALEQRPGMVIILVFWPIYVLIYGIAEIAQWTVDRADSAKYKREHT